MMSWKFGSAAAVTAVVQFVTAWAVLGANREGYAPASQAISELAEVGSSTRGAMTASFVLFGLLVSPFAQTLLRALPGDLLASAAVLLNAGGSLAAGVFACSPGCPGPAASTMDLAHVMAASVAYLGLILAPLATAWRLQRVGARPGLRRVCLGLGLLTLTGIVAWVGGLGGEAGGGLQRAATTTGDAWYIVAAIAILTGGGRLYGGGAADSPGPEAGGGAPPSETRGNGPH